VAIYLADAGWRVSVVNPARVKGFAQSQLTRNKNDRIDAKLLAAFARRVELEPWQAPSPTLRELRALVECLQALTEMRQQELNHLEAMAQVTPMPGLVALRHNPVIVAMAERLRQRGLAPKAIVGAGMRRLVHRVYGVVTSGKPFDADIPLAGLALQDGI